MGLLDIFKKHRSLLKDDIAETDLSKQLINIQDMIALDHLDISSFVPAIKELIDKAPKVPEGYSNLFSAHYLLSEIRQNSIDSAINIANGLIDKGYGGIDMPFLMNEKYGVHHIRWDDFLYGGVSSRDADSSYFGELVNYAQKVNDSDHVKNIFPLYTDALKEKGDHLKGSSKDVMLEELQKMTPDTVPELDPKFISSEQGQEFDRQLAGFINNLYRRSSDTLGGSPSPLGKESLRVLKEFAKKGYPIGQEMMIMIAEKNNDKKAVNDWAQKVAKNPFATEEQKKSARDDIKNTQAFMAQAQSRGGR